jgi:hypothetical protein
MSVPAGHTWTCAGCGRQVPQRVDACHCGSTRAQALAARHEARAARGQRPPAPGEGWRVLWRSLPRDVKAMVVAASVVLLAGFGWLVFAAPAPAAAPALLGYVERPVTTLRPAPPPQPPFKLPWWK